MNLVLVGRACVKNSDTQYRRLTPLLRRGERRIRSLQPPWRERSPAISIASQVFGSTLRTSVNWRARFRSGVLEYASAGLRGRLPPLPAPTTAPAAMPA